MEVDLRSVRPPDRLKSESIYGSERFLSVATTTSSIFTEPYSTPFEHTPPQGSQPPATTFVRRKLEDHEYEERGAIKKEDFDEDIEMDTEDTVLRGLGVNDDINSQFDQVVERMKQINLTGKVKRMGEHPVAAGGFGEIWQGVFGRKQVAIKVARRRSFKPDQASLRRAAREMSAWNSFKYKHVIPLFGFVVESGGWVSLVSPWQQNGRANEFLVGKSWKIAMNVIVGACLGLRYLHSRGMIHGDFRGDNILIDNKGTAILNDFGLSRTLQTSLFQNTVTVGNPAWTALELLLSEDVEYIHTYATDVWACGMTLMELFWCERPYGKLRDGAVAMALNNRQLPSHPEPNHEPLWEICSHCWNFIPESRVTMRQLVKMLQDCMEDAPPIFGCGVPGSDDIDRWVGNAYTLLSSGNLVAAEKAASTAISACRLVLPPDSPLIMRSIWCRALVCETKGASGRIVLQQFEEPSWRKYESHGFPYASKLDALVAVCLILGCSDCLHMILEYERLHQFTLGNASWERRASLRTFLSVQLNILGYDHPDVLSTMFKLVQEYTEASEYSELVNIERMLVDRQERVLGVNHKDTVLAMEQLSSTYHKLKLNEDHLRLEKKMAMRRVRRSHADQDWTDGDVNSPQLTIGAILQTQRRVLGDDHFDVLSTLTRLEKMYNVSGDWIRLVSVEEAMLDIQERASEFQNQWLRIPFGDTLDILKRLSRMYHNLGDLQRHLHMEKKILKQHVMHNEEESALLTEELNILEGFFEL